MKTDPLVAEVDRRHVRQLFDLFWESGYDALAMIEAYGVMPDRKRADDGSEYHILKQPISIFHEIERTVLLPPKEQETEKDILHWMGEIYVYAHYEEGLSFGESMKAVPPGWLYLHYSPLHETSLSNGWRKAFSIRREKAG